MNNYRSDLRKNVIVSGLISAAYLLLSFWLIGFKSDQLVLVAIFNILFLVSGVTRKFIVGFSVFIIFWILFDYMKAFPNYRFNTVHIGSLYEAEKSLFGIMIGGKVYTPNEYWVINNNSFLDVFSGFAYLCWIPVPLVFAGRLFFKDRKRFFYFSLSFLLINLIGFIGYYVYPAAPPWYVQQYGFTFNPSTPGNTAGLARFDKFFNVSVFSGLYSKSSNVFAAMPSLHSAYPTLVLYYGLKGRMGLINIFFAVVTAGIWFAAVYSSHHYVLDVMAGISCAVLGIVLFHYMQATRWFQQFLSHLMRLTA
ncbi:phosphatase PAP2 family protein [Filimonas effusa]|uniref:Inositol phosphorylceramide synthase n=1 Tax=Filimonas effusa TaxID=2508721 RepID=A0A4Q1D3Q6_9BACT|nr:phosphatase PAP2 family protein [Filimonas effusa]RXK82958.1 inositol phosphorylceramide synthase [Filimonas effusa]